MVQHVSTMAFEGIEARAVDVQVQVAPGLPAFAMVGSIHRLASRPIHPAFTIAGTINWAGDTARNYHTQRNRPDVPIGRRSHSAPIIIPTRMD